MCADPQCQLCSPQRYASLAMPGYSPSFWQYQPGSIKVDLDNKTFANVFGDTSKWTLNLTSKPKEQPMSSSDTQRVINDPRELEESELPAISNEIDRIKRENKERIVKGLDGLVALELLKDSDMRRFVIAYYQSGEAKVVKGVEFGDTDMVSEKDEEKEYRVYIQGRDYPVSGYKYTMSRLRKALDGGNTPYRIAYYED